MMKSINKRFEELTNMEIYKMFRLRSEVFVVEQECSYLDIDEIDLEAIHSFILNDSEDIVAYTRIYKSDGVYKIGRVIVAPNYRGNKYGYDVMRQSLEVINSGQFDRMTEQVEINNFENIGNLEVDPIVDRNIIISAQARLIDFYRNIGFTEISEEYLEDGISHIDMRWQQMR